MADLIRKTKERKETDRKSLKYFKDKSEMIGVLGKIFRKVSGQESVVLKDEEYHTHRKRDWYSRKVRDPVRVYWGP